MFYPMRAETSGRPRGLVDFERTVVSPSGGFRGVIRTAAAGSCGSDRLTPKPVTWSETAAGLRVQRIDQLSLLALEGAVDEGVEGPLVFDDAIAGVDLAEAGPLQEGGRRFRLNQNIPPAGPPAAD